MHRFCVKTIKQDLSRAVRDIVAVRIGDKDQIRNGCHKDPAKPILNGTEVDPFVEKHRSLIELTVSILILKN